jgi:hypothetical protein
MSLPVVTVASGGIAVVDVTAMAPKLGLPVIEAAQGLAVTKVAALGLPVTFETSGPVAPTTISARFWRMTITGFTGAAEAGIKHIEFAKLGETASAPVSAAASTSNGSFPAANAIDGNASTLWVAASGAVPQTMTLDYGAPIDVNVVRLLPRSDLSYITAFSISHSSDGTTFTPVAGWSPSGINRLNYDTSTIAQAQAFPNPAATAGGKPLWRLNVTAVDNNTQLALNELEFRGTVGGADLTGSGQGRSWHRSTGFSLPAANAFDNNNTTTYHETATDQTGILGWEFKDSKQVAQISILPRSSNPAQSPENFTLQHSADGVAWTTALTVTAQTGWTTAARVFTVP